MPPCIIGLYGVSGCGKTFLLNQLKTKFHDYKTPIAFYDGSQVIDSVVPGGINTFLAAEDPEQKEWRRSAIESIKEKTRLSGGAAVVAGHFLLWDPQTQTGNAVYTENDLQTYTHILYLNVSSDVIYQRRRDDQKKARPQLSRENLERWQEAEKDELRQVCPRHDILYMQLGEEVMTKRGPEIIKDLVTHNETYNIGQAVLRLDGIMRTNHKQCETVIVLDADRTLTAQDTGLMFWEEANRYQTVTMTEGNPLKKLFGGPMGYSYSAFLQAALMYEEAFNDNIFETLCQDVAKQTALYPEMRCLLHFIAHQSNVQLMIVTCGVGQIWDHILHTEGLSEHVAVIGGGRLHNGLIVTPGVKEVLVSHLQESYGFFVWAFGDSPLDLPMLKKANRAVVVVGDTQTRSQTMEDALASAIESEGLRAHQAVLAHGAAQLLTFEKLPPARLTQREFVAQIMARGRHLPQLRVIDATEKTATRLLMTNMRDSRYSGPLLRDVHRRVGAYLATEYLTDLIGLEKYPVRHVQGHDIDGYRLSHEHRTLIVALMRGGEPIASGVNDVFPAASFLHARQPADICAQHLEGLVTIILVDSVINSGETVAGFLQHIRNLHATVRVVIVAGVLQEKSTSPTGSLGQLSQEGPVEVVTLRLSENQFTGKGATDTGNRLFNTTHLP
jgi:uracil phosphoribosyltransferase/phosphoserine phosphatase/adenylate kinase